MKSLKLVKGGVKVNLSQEVNLKFGQLIARAAYFKKKKELKNLRAMFIEYYIESNEHLILIELLKQYEYLMELGPVPFKFVGEYIEKIDSFLEKENKRAKKA